MSTKKTHRFVKTPQNVHKSTKACSTSVLSEFPDRGRRRPLFVQKPIGKFRFQSDKIQDNFANAAGAASNFEQQFFSHGGYIAEIPLPSEKGTILKCVSMAFSAWLSDIVFHCCFGYKISFPLPQNHAIDHLQALAPPSEMAVLFDWNLPFSR